VRKTGHSGRFPVKGDGSFDWVKILSTPELPSILNPDKGYIVTANNRITAPGYPYPLSFEFGAPYRAKRIEQLIQNFINVGTKFTMDIMKQIQLDVKSLPFERLKFIFENMKFSDSNLENWRQRLVKWDGQEVIGVEEPSIFEAWLIQMGHIVGKEAKFIKNTEIFYNILKNNTAYNCTTYVDPKFSSCESFAEEAFKETIQFLTASYGKIPKWGIQVHETQFYNSAIGQSILSCLVNVLVPQPGGSDTVFANEVGLSPDLNMDPKLVGFWGPSYRQITDLSDLEKSIFILAPGNSGNILSKDYRGTVALWAAGQYLPMKMKDYEKFENLLLNKGG
jgi:penicillin G amidase